MAISAMNGLTGNRVVPITRKTKAPAEPATQIRFGEQFTPSTKENITDDPLPINFNMPVTSQSASMLIGHLKQAAQMKKQAGGTIKLLINTPGGEAHAGIQAANFIKGSSVPVDTVVLGGEAASMGSLLFLSGTGRRVMTTDSSLMFHQPRMMLNAQLTATDLGTLSDKALRLKSQMDRLIARVTELPLDEVAEMTKKDTYIYPLEALKKGFATHVLKNDDLSQALTPETVEDLSDEEVARRDLEHDYEGLKTEDFDPKNVDKEKIREAQQRRKQPMMGLPFALSGGGAGMLSPEPGQAPPGMQPGHRHEAPPEEEQPGFHSKEPRLILMA